MKWQSHSLLLSDQAVRCVDLVLIDRDCRSSEMVTGKRVESNSVFSIVAQDCDSANLQL